MGRVAGVSEKKAKLVIQGHRFENGRKIFYESLLAHCQLGDPLSDLARKHLNRPAQPLPNNNIA
jgi:hypothetical protein